MSDCRVPMATCAAPAEGHPLEYVDAVLRENRRLEAENAQFSADNAALRSGRPTGAEFALLDAFLNAIACLDEEPCDPVELARREDAVMADFASRIIVIDGRGL